MRGLKNKDGFGINLDKAYYIVRFNYIILLTGQKNFTNRLLFQEKNNAVLISEDDWNSIQETLYLCSIPGMRESILEASKESLEESVKELNW